MSCFRHEITDLIIGYGKEFFFCQDPFELLSQEENVILQQYEPVSLA